MNQIKEEFSIFWCHDPEIRLFSLNYSMVEKHFPVRESNRGWQWLRSPGFTQTWAYEIDLPSIFRLNWIGGESAPVISPGQKTGEALRRSNPKRERSRFRLVQWTKSFQGEWARLFTLPQFFSIHQSGGPLRDRLLVRVSNRASRYFSVYFWVWDIGDSCYQDSLECEG